MHTQILRSLLSLTALACALSACGGTDIAAMNAPVQTAAAIHVVDVSVDPASRGKNPLPDCADQACAGLRIIDGNAEAYRVDAMRRAGS